MSTLMVQHIDPQLEGDRGVSAAPAAPAAERSSDSTPDFGLFPWTLASIAWLLMPLLLPCLQTGLFLYAWAPLAGLAFVLAALLALARLVQRRRPSEFTLRSLRSLLLQGLIVGAVMALYLL